MSVHLQAMASYKASSWAHWFLFGRILERSICRTNGLDEPNTSSGYRGCLYHLGN